MKLESEPVILRKLIASEGKIIVSKRKQKLMKKPAKKCQL